MVGSDDCRCESCVRTQFARIGYERGWNAHAKQRVEVTEAMVSAAKRVLFHESEDCDDDIRAALEAALNAEGESKEEPR